MRRLFTLMVGCGSLILSTLAPAHERQEDKMKPVFAFVALKKLTSPSTEQVRKALISAFGEKQKIDIIEIDKKAISFSVNGQNVIYAFMDFPIPWGDLEYPCEVSWLWPDATKELRDHKAHIIVIVTSDSGTHLDRCVLLTKLLSAAADTFDSVGVYWGHGSVVLSPDLLRQFAKDATVGNPPLLAWINFYVQQSKSGTVKVLTEGMDYFDCKEIEIIDSRKPLVDVLDTVSGAAYLMIKGEIIRDGDTIGFDADQKIKTKHMKSVRDEKADVLRIEY